jgi:hypothetical protein
MNDELLSIDVNGSSLGYFPDSPESYVNKIDGDICVNHEDTTRTKIGSFKAIFVDVIGARDQQISGLEVFDTDQITCDYFMGLYKVPNVSFKSEVLSLAKTPSNGNPNLLILDRLSILPEYRRHSFGLEALRALILRFRVGAGLIAMKPFPLQFEEPDEDSDHELMEERGNLKLEAFPTDKLIATRKLCKHYAKLGFKKVPTTDYMILGPRTRM